MYLGKDRDTVDKHNGDIAYQVNSEVSELRYLQMIMLSALDLELSALLAMDAETKRLFLED